MSEVHRRPVPRLDASELETAVAFLNFQREALAIKCDGLSEAELREVRVGSGTNLLGLAQHMIDGERFWFAHHVLGEAFDGDFGMEVDPEKPAHEVLEEYAATWARSNEIIASIGDPGRLSALPVVEAPLPLRWVIAHVTAETARHAGHADIIREQIDGATGR